MIKIAKRNLQWWAVVLAVFILWLARSFVT